MSRGVLVFAAIALASAQTKWKHVSTFKLDWNGHKGVQVLLDVPDQWDEAGVFARIRIHVPGQKTFTLRHKTGWVRVGRMESGGLSNDGPSRYALVRRIAENRTAMFLFGHSFGSSPGALDVIELTPEGQPRLVLRRDELGLKDVRDLDGDGIAEVVGYPCLSEGTDGDLWTYNPYHVYKLGAAATLSIALSKSYNLKHYYGWAGIQCRVDVVVVRKPPKGGRPFIMSRRAAERLMLGQQ